MPFTQSFVCVGCIEREETVAHLVFLLNDYSSTFLDTVNNLSFLNY